MRFFFKAAMMIIAVAASVIFADRAFAAVDTPIQNGGFIEFTGEDKPEELTSYYIDESLKINEGDSFYFPKTSILTIKKGGELQIYVGGEISIGGALIIEQGARVVVSGELKAYEGSRIECFGELVSTGKSVVELAGELSNGESAAAVFGGTTNVYKSCVLKNSGAVTFSKSAIAVVSGKYEDTKSGRLFIKGELNTTLNARISVGGYVYLSGELLNTGVLVFREGAVDMLSDGKLKTGKSGRILDERIDEQEKQSEESSAKILRGIDVSYWQGAIEWEKVKAAGIDFAFMRASLGDYYVDETFDYNITEAQRAGVKVGVYHYLKASSVEAARTEAKFFLEVLKPYEPDFPIVVDVEDSKHESLSAEELTRITAVFCEEIKKAGYTPMIYASASWLTGKLNTKQLSNYEIWVAHWGALKPSFRGSYGVWQYSSKGRVSGIKGDVDLNVAYKNYSKK